MGRELLTAIDAETDRLNRLVTNLLDLSRIEAGALKPSREWYEASEIIGNVLERSSYLLDGRKLVVDLPERSSLIDVDFVMISEVLANLLENAVKYSPRGAPVHITAHEREDMLEIRVKDQGIGVPAGEEERIFDKFYRVEARRRTSGSGMGLAISRGFVEAHGGTIWVERNPAGGSTFALSLPLASNGAVVAHQVRREVPR